jgi:rhodanese-related sulfurtransferase
MRVPWWIPFGKIDEIAPRDLYAKLQHDGDDLQLLDVREVAEFKTGHIARARSVPVHDLPRRLSDLKLDPNKPVIAICLSGHRSIPAFRLLKRAGFRQVLGLGGGMIAWNRDHLPTTLKGDR